VVDVIHETLLCLGRRYGWDLALVEQARRIVVDSGLVFTWTSPWKSSPGRRRRARIHFWLAPDGWGRSVLEIARAIDGVILLRSPTFTAYVGRKGFRRSTQTLRWLSTDEVEFSPFVTPFGDEGTSVRLVVGPELDGPLAAAAALPVWALDRTEISPPFRIDAVDVTEPPETARIQVIGGGPMNGVDSTYEIGKRDALEQLRDSSEWLDWWRPANAGTLEIWWKFDPFQIGPSVRKLPTKVIARIIRSAASTQDAPDPAELGRQDVIDLMLAVAKRVGRADPPLHLLRGPF
jgi:hypothetical protein